MGSTIGSAKLILGDQVLKQWSRFSGAVQVMLNQRVIPKSLSVLLQSREQTQWTEMREVYNDYKKKYEIKFVEVGSSDVQTILEKQQIKNNFGDAQYGPGSYTFPFVINIPTWLKPAMLIKSGGATAQYGYQLIVSLNSNLGEHCSTLPMPGPRGIDLANTESGEIDLYHRFEGIVKFKPLLREEGVVTVTASYNPDTVIPGEPYQIILYLDNSGNRYDLTTGYFSLEQNVKFNGTDAVFHNNEVMQIEKLDCLPLSAGAFVQHHSCSFVAYRYLPPSFYGNIIRTQYLLRLHLGSRSKLTREQSIVLSEVTILPRQGIAEYETEAVPLDEKVSDDERMKREFAAVLTGAVLLIGLWVGRDLVAELLEKIF